MMLVATGISLVGGLVAVVSQGIGRPAAEWLQAITFLRKAGEAPELSAGRLASLADMERMLRMNMIELPKMMNNDQQVLRELRTAEPEPA